MLTVHQVAVKYGVSVAFMLLALEKIGFQATSGDTLLPLPVVNEFAAAFGTKIAIKRPRPPAEFKGVSDEALPAAAVAARAVGRKPKHVMRVAHARVTGGRDAQGVKVKKLLDDPGPLHAIDAAGTHDGDPWRGEVIPGAVYFYGGGPQSGPRSACGYTNVRAVLGDEFFPSEHPERDGQCPKCAEAVRDGKGFRTPPYERELRRQCEEDLRLIIRGKRVVEYCDLRDFHIGRHRTGAGASWALGFEDYRPAQGIDPGSVKPDAS